ncbi:hypothetical protein K8Q93_01205 [Candidatus Parcubacteria bacterium]|nr:hypothetical protein [Candidatus Parcubacteria bacterium]
MHNLLPEKEKSAVSTDYILRLATAGFLGLGAVAFAGILLLLPAYGYLSARAEIAATTSPSLLVEKILGEEAALRLTKEMLSLVPPEGGNLSPSNVLLRLRASVASTQGINLTFIGYQAAGGVSVRGVAQTRDALIAFGKVLKADPVLSDISIPVELLAKSRDITFELRGTIKY